MSKNSKKRSATEAAKAGTKADEQKMSAADTAKAVSENVLEDMLGIGVEKPADPELPDEEMELEVEEDRKRLLLQGLGMLAISIALLFVAAANITGNVVLLLVLIFDLTAVWFVCKGMGKRFNRYASRVHVIDFGRRNILLYLKSDPKKAQVVVYKDIKNYKLIRQGGSLRLLLAGNWVTHPSGYQLVDINRPFMKDSLDGLAAQIKDVMREHRVNERS